MVVGKKISYIIKKIALAKINNKKEIEVWGDWKQIRSFIYIDDCLTGIQKYLTQFKKTFII